MSKWNVLCLSLMQKKHAFRDFSEKDRFPSIVLENVSSESKYIYYLDGNDPLRSLVENMVTGEGEIVEHVKSH